MVRARVPITRPVSPRWPAPGSSPALGAGRRAFGAALRLLVFGLLAGVPLRAIIFFSTGDLAHNTTAPAGDLAGCGWQWVGSWRGVQGTPIGPRHFLAARHVGGAVGDPFVFRGVSYTTVASYDDPLSDLRVWEVDVTFPTWASLYRAGDEVGKPLVVIGGGRTRGAEVRDSATNSLRGWQWGPSDGNLRWGRNVVASVKSGVAYWGSLLYATFDQNGGPDEAHLGQEDSSGPVFIHDGTGWKLAGVSAAVDASFNTTNSGPGFNAAIFDARGLYYGSSGNWTLITGTTPVPSGFYATRVSVRTAWIDGLVPPVTPPPPLSLAATPGVWHWVAAAGLLGVGAAARSGWMSVRRGRPVRIGTRAPAR